MLQFFIAAFIAAFILFYFTCAAGLKSGKAVATLTDFGTEMMQRSLFTRVTVLLVSRRHLGTRKLTCWKTPRFSTAISWKVKLEAGLEYFVEYFVILPLASCPINAQTLPAHSPATDDNSLIGW